MFVSPTPDEIVATKDSYVVRCIIKPRPDSNGLMFTQHEDGTVTAALDGYAIVPRAEYERLAAAAPHLLEPPHQTFIDVTEEGGGSC